jgi:uncharacterized protein (TIGR01319 family)
VQDIHTIIATDCGSTTTKAIMIQRRGEEYRLTCRGEAPTTVEAPFDDVTVGVRNAVREIEELSGRKLLGEDGLIVPERGPDEGADLYLSTSSAGGGLQMMVAGVVKAMSAESAERAALGAGAIVIDTVAVDDGRKDYQKVERIRQVRPDMLLMSGGTDGGTVSHLVDLAEMIVAADPRPRLGVGMKIPVIYAGNKDAADAVAKTLDDRVSLHITPNLRPTLEKENLLPAREAIHDLFLDHVMQQAPGYHKLLTWTSRGIMATPNAVGEIIRAIAKQRRIDVLAADIGGATTDVFSVFGETFNRTVSANLGMSYSICNVMTEAGIPRIMRWIPFSITEDDLRNRLRNKMIRPTTVPQTLEDLYIEQAVSREALRLAFEHHKSLARGLKGVQQSRSIGDALTQGGTGRTLVDLFSLDMIVGSGGVLSHAPLRAQTALMMTDAYEPLGVTALAVDSIFMMPQLGVLSTVLPEAATQVFERDCLIMLGPCIAPSGQARPGEEVCTVRMGDRTVVARAGEIRTLPLGPGEKAEVEVIPARGLDMGEGRGKPVRRTVEGGVVGVIADGRGRPLSIPSEPAERIRRLSEWMDALGLPAPEKSR